eukprot:302295-Rhodomonas_salina.1
MNASPVPLLCSLLHCAGDLIALCTRQHLALTLTPETQSRDARCRRATEGAAASQPCSAGLSRPRSCPTHARRGLRG